MVILVLVVAATAAVEVVIAVELVSVLLRIHSKKIIIVMTVIIAKILSASVPKLRCDTV